MSPGVEGPRSVARDGGPSPGASGGRRPLLTLALALAAGGALGLHAAALAPSAALALATLLALALAARRPRPAVLALSILAFSCALRAAAAGDARPGTPAARERAPIGRAGGQGRLELEGARFAVEPGLLRAGELAGALAGGAPRHAARGAAEEEPVELPIPLAADELVRLAPPATTLLDLPRRGLTRLRSGCLLRLEALSSPTVRGLAGALLVGERSGLRPELSDLFTRTGTRHALAVSGLHVGLVAMLFVWPLGGLLALVVRRLGAARGRSGRGAPELWRALLLLAFVPLAGAGAPVVRAAFALALAQAAPLLPAVGGVARRPDALSLWALAACLELLADPRSIDSLSLQLSYLATLGLIVAGRGSVRAVRACLPAGGELPAATRAGHRLPELPRALVQRALGLATGALGLSVAANLATLPVVWARFGEWSAVGLLATPLLVPLLAVFLAAGWAWLALPCPALEGLLELAAAAMVGLLQAWDGLPGTPAPLPPRPVALVALAAGAALALLARTPGRTPARPWRLRLAAGCGGLALLPWAAAPSGLEVHALEVGHGTACLIRAPGAGCWIFDAGSRDRPGVARRAVAPLLRRWEVSYPAVCLSHGERDHADALEWLVERFPPRLWAGALPAHLAERLPHGIRRVDLRAGALELAPAGGARRPLRLRLVRGGPLAGNEGSRALELRWGSERLLLCGDAEGPGLAAMLRGGWLAGPCELLLLPHHGSETDLLGPLLDRTRPARVWISAPARPPVLPELERRAIPWSCTGVHGPLRYAGGGTLSDARPAPSDGASKRASLRAAPSGAAPEGPRAARRKRRHVETNE